MEKSIDDLLNEFEASCKGLDADEVAQAKELLAEILQMPAEKLRWVHWVLETSLALEDLGDPELVDDFWRRLGVDVAES